MFVRARVLEVVINDAGRATGVRAAPVNMSGEEDADAALVVSAASGVISGAGAFVTNRLVPAAHRPRLGYEAMLQAPPY